MKFCIIDYKLGNIKSIQSFLSELKISSYLSDDSKIIKNADVILLPGVGTFGSAISFLKQKKLDRIIINRFRDNKPIIGICLGMQLFFESSSENGNYQGLGLIKGKLTKNRESHIGWNNLHNKKNDFFEINNKYFYFNHSYSVKYSNLHQNYFSNYEKKITTLIKINNFVGLQFHPEKSQINGINLMKKILKSFNYA
jgi:glutamine amidotransferase